jgi:hypothetical protein
VSAVLGRPKGALSITTLKVPGSILAEVTVWSSTVENECDRTCGSGRAPVVVSARGCCVEASSASTAGSGGGGGVGSERGVLAP